MTSMITDYLNGLNDRQKEAVIKTKGPLLILAGAGSGKTRVLVHRIAYLIDHEDVQPGNIMAITFTNKAAGEMRERVDKIVGFGAGQIWVSTFHSSCVRILRANIDRLDYNRNFSIYDTDDQLKLMKEICHKMDIDTKRYKERGFLSAISRAKDELIDPVHYERNAGDEYEDIVAKVYKKYQNALKENNALDFDDLIMLTVRLFKECPEVLKFYQDKFQYIMVDEYQDTNTAQFKFVSLLASKYHNLCVVGDDDQSIYKFRGANITNILNFEKIFPEAQVIRLEQNYRSTKNILNCANNVIKNNLQRKQKTLWTENLEGEKPRFRRFENGYAEAEFVADDIARGIRRHLGDYKDFAVLYRTNAQSRLFEEKFIMANIPYRVVGGVNFYSRMEIKDVLSYLKTINNGDDSVALKRIINVPKRGIGSLSIAKIEEYAEGTGMRLYDALSHAADAGLALRAAVKIDKFVETIEEMRRTAEEGKVSGLIKSVLEKTGYLAELQKDPGEEKQARIENIDELISKAVQYEENAKEPSLAGFLEEVALIADIDSVNDNDNAVLIMTLHSSKGLEFPYVYIAGMEDGVLPSYLSIDSGDSAEMEEERRLTYVGITRAQKGLTMTAAAQRMIRGNVEYNPVSRFAREIPKDMVDLGYSSDGNEKPKFVSYGSYEDMGDAIRSKNPVLHMAPSAFKSGTRRKHSGTSSGNPYSRSSAKQFEVATDKGLDYGVGDRVSHARFGEGTVKDITGGGRDYEVTVDFGEGGIKKMFASFAKLQKI